MKYENYTRFGIHDKAERYVLSAYTSFIFLSSLIGDTLILIGSIRYNAIKLHKIMVVFIQYIAVADLVISIVRLLPGAVSLVANVWVFGDFLCSAGFFISGSFGGTIALLIGALTFAKFLIVKYPLRAVDFSKRAGHLTTLVMFSCMSSFGVLVAAEKGAYFSYVSYNCDYALPVHKSKIDYVFGVVIGGVGLFTTGIITVSSVMLLFLAKKIADRRAGGLQWQGIRTVLLTVVVYAIATVPLVVNLFEHPKIQPQSTPTSYIAYTRFAMFILYLQAPANFFIYTASLTSFQEFLKSRIRAVFASIRRRFVSNEDQRTAQQARERDRLLP
ncbi:somatostatin receptor type 5-like [Bolinopsis microptera]|uniref:somatostatin receptor type 5-like n=1 Tax=Bolinopsis microptera TaxID=2820187 RepID=UPI0030798307